MIFRLRRVQEQFSCTEDGHEDKRNQNTGCFKLLVVSYAMLMKIPVYKSTRERDG